MANVTVKVELDGRLVYIRDYEVEFSKNFEEYITTEKDNAEHDKIFNDAAVEDIEMVAQAVVNTMKEINNSVDIEYIYANQEQIESGCIGC